MDSGVATRPIEDMEAYASNSRALFTRPACSCARCSTPPRPCPTRKRVAYAEGEDERVLRAAQIAVDDHIARPILIGRPAVIAARIAKAGLRIQPGVMWRSATPRTIRVFASTGRPTTRSWAAMASRPRCQGRRAPLQHHHRLADGQAGRRRCHDVRLGGRSTRTWNMCTHHRPRPAWPGYATLNALMTDRMPAVHRRHLCERRPHGRATGQTSPGMAARKSALRPAAQGGVLSHSNFGSSKPRLGAQDARGARPVCEDGHPDIECDGELQGDAALEPNIRAHLHLADSTLTGSKPIC
jgi:malate dehydrogenase (oxaloacetate-decarboxylating)(NADP+)